MMKLYGFPPSPRTWQVRAVAAHLGIPLDFEFVDLTKGVQHTPEYRALNPSGRAPTLVDGDFKLWETAAIAQYLASKTPNTLWPDDARTRAGPKVGTTTRRTGRKDLRCPWDSPARCGHWTARRSPSTPPRCCTA